MPKKETEIFDGIKEESPVAVSEAKEPPKKRKSRKPLGDEEKQALIDRLKKGREKKRLMREAKLNEEVKEVKKEIEQAKEQAKTEKKDNSNLDELKKELQELKQMIRDSKNNKPPEPSPLKKVESPVPQEQEKPKPLEQKPAPKKVVEPKPAIVPIVPAVPQLIRKKKKWR